MNVLLFDQVTELHARPAPPLDGQAQARLFRMLATQYQVGIPLEKALDFLVSEQEFFLLSAVSRRLKTGYSIHQSFAKGTTFDSTTLGLLALGEKTGRLEQSLTSLAELFEWRAKTQNDIKARLTYPLILSVLCALMVALGPIILAAPIIAFLQSSGMELAPLTMCFIALSSVMRSPLTWLILCGTGFSTFRLIQRFTERHPGKLEDSALRLPGLGSFLRVLYSARFARALLACQEAGYPLVLSLGLAADCSGSQTIKNEAARAIRALVEGASLQACWKHLGTLEPILVSSVSVGFTTGRSEALLAGALSLLNESLTHRLQVLLGYLEPLLLTGMGLMVGTTVLATCSPMLTLIRNLA